VQPPSIYRLAMINDEIRSLLDAPPTGEDAPSLDAIEHTLTSGYASALALEAERRRLERQIAAVAAKLGQGSSRGQSELTELGQKLTAADGDLTQLRRLLSSLRTRAHEVRASP
jgi:hypothetical protein